MGNVCLDPIAGTIGHTPAGVLVAIRSPASRVMILEAASMRSFAWFA
jgi:hypothetical protein